MWCTKKLMKISFRTESIRKTPSSSMSNPQSAALFASFQANLNQQLSRETVLAVAKQVFGDIFADFQRVLNEHQCLSRTRVLNEHQYLSRTLVFELAKQVIDRHYATRSAVTVDEVVSDRQVFSDFQRVLNDHQQLNRDTVLLQTREQVVTKETPEKPVVTSTWFIISLIQGLLILLYVYVTYFNIDISTYLTPVTRFRQCLLA